MDEEIITTNEDPTPEPTPEPTPVVWTILDDVKLALRLTTDAYNNELTALINAALADLGVAGVVAPLTVPEEGSGEVPTLSTDDPLIKIAVITYCKMMFGAPDEYDRLKRSYDEQKAQLRTNTGHTDWLVSNG